MLDLVRGVGARIYPVGRLDYLSEGLLLLTNDGELAQKLMHASSHVAKTYLVKIGGKATEEQIDKLRAGITLPAERRSLKTPADRLPKAGWKRRSTAVKTAPVRIKLVRDAANPWYEVTLVEGRNRQIRRMFEQIEHHVEKIKRVRYGPLVLDVEPGEFRHLTAQEVAQLKGGSRMDAPRGKAGPSTRTKVLGRDDSPGMSSAARMKRLAADDRAIVRESRRC